MCTRHVARAVLPHRVGASDGSEVPAHQGEDAPGPRPNSFRMCWANCSARTVQGELFRAAVRQYDRPGCTASGEGHTRGRIPVAAVVAAPTRRSVVLIPAVWCRGCPLPDCAGRGSQALPHRVRYRLRAKVLPCRGSEEPGSRRRRGAARVAPMVRWRNYVARIVRPLPCGWQRRTDGVALSRRCSVLTSLCLDVALS